MTALVWDKVGERTYQAGVDRGVLYLGGAAAAWNGLTSVEDSTPQNSRTHYQDGVKYLEEQLIGEFEGSLKAFTYPELFDGALGIVPVGGGAYLHEQPPTNFGLTYRTKLGDDLNGLDRGYVIHLFYNLYATPDSVAHSTVADTVEALEFSWKLSSTPKRISGRRPTSHLSVRSTSLSPLSLAALEAVLYGSEQNDPYLPSMADVVSTITNPGQPLTVVDNGDGTWTASGSFLSIKLIGDTEFEILHSDAVMLDAVTYSLPTT